jgi:hypothetical protein
MPRDIIVIAGKLGGTIPRSFFWQNRIFFQSVMTTVRTIALPERGNKEWVSRCQRKK